MCVYYLESISKCTFGHIIYIFNAIGSLHLVSCNPELLWNCAIFVLSHHFLFVSYQIRSRKRSNVWLAETEPPACKTEAACHIQMLWYMRSRDTLTSSQTVCPMQWPVTLSSGTTWFLKWVYFIYLDPNCSCCLQIYDTSSANTRWHKYKHFMRDSWDLYVVPRLENIDL